MVRNERPILEGHIISIHQTTRGVVYFIEFKEPSDNIGLLFFDHQLISSVENRDVNFKSLLNE